MADDLGFPADLEPRIHTAEPLPLPALIDLKRSRQIAISVCLPALNEESTIGEICNRIAPLAEAGLVDELVVVDSGSADATVAAALGAGAAVYRTADVLPEIAPDGGKGAALWKSLAVLRGDVVVWVDSDTRNFSSDFVTTLIGPLLSDPSVIHTKAFYERPFATGEQSLRTGGARVTELVVRPLCHLLFPELTGFIQPLSGEYAAYRDTLRALPFFTGYGIEIGLLIDLVSQHGLASTAQVDLGSRMHRNQDVLALGRMSFQIMQVMTQRAQEMGRLKLEGEWPERFVQFAPTAGGAAAIGHDLQVTELPPMKSVL
ncbi:MAG: glucosyl-3-phosphoglycerate synthase [Actinomycetota bacterium]|nr:glucosyl-3-phosphoglycerate synthase [Actinomycetota bacterium]